MSKGNVSDISKCPHPQLKQHPFYAIQVLKAASLKIMLIWNVVLCSLVDFDGLLRDLYCPLLQGLHDVGRKVFFESVSILYLLAFTKYPTEMSIF
jgi:hypothetical protein